MKRNVITCLLMAAGALLITIVLALTGIVKPLVSGRAQYKLADTHYEHVGLVADGVSIRQTFQVEDKEFDSLAVCVATFASVKYGSMEAALLDSAGNQLQSWTFRTEVIRDGGYVYMQTDKPLEGNGAFYTLCITDSADPGNGITLWKFSDHRYEGELTINGEKAEGELLLGWNVLEKSPLNYIYLFVWLFGAAFLVWLFITCKAWNKIQAALKDIGQEIRRNRKTILLFVLVQAVLAPVCYLLVKSGLLHFVLMAEPSTRRITFLYAVFVYAMLTTLSVLFFFREYLKDRIEVVWLLVGAVLGVAYLICFPAGIFVSWDEQIHYYRSVLLSRSVSGYMNVAEEMMYYNGTGVVDRSGWFQPGAIHAGQDFYQTIYQAWQRSYDYPALEAYNLYVPSYLPSALGLALGRLLHLPMSACFKLGQAGNLVLYLILVYLAIKKLESGKLILITCALTVTNFYLATRYNYDIWMTGFFFVGFAYFFTALRTADRAKPTNEKEKDAWIALFSLMVGCFPKAVYCPMLLLLLWVPDKCFVSVKHRILYHAAIYASCVYMAASLVLLLHYVVLIGAVSFVVIWGVLLLLEKIPKKTRRIVIGSAAVLVLAGGYAVFRFVFLPLMPVGDLRGGDVNSQQQLLNILRNPGPYLTVLFRFLKNDYFSMDGEGWLYNHRSLGHLGVSFIKMLPALMVTAVAVFDQPGDRNFDHYQGVKWTSLAMMLFMVCLIATSLYVSFTPVGAEAITGCQPRYLLPLSFPFLFLIGSPRVKNQMNPCWTGGIVLFLGAFLVLEAMWQKYLCLLV